MRMHGYMHCSWQASGLSQIEGSLCNAEFGCAVCTYATRFMDLLQTGRSYEAQLERTYRAVYKSRLNKVGTDWVLAGPKHQP